MVPELRAIVDRKSRIRECPNCGSEEVHDFCSWCGQAYFESTPPFGAWLRDVLDDTLSLSGRVPRTLWELLSQPGHLTAEWKAGRRRRYVHPFRLYFLAGAVFLSIATVMEDAAVLEYARGFLYGFTNYFDESVDQAAAVEILVANLPRVAFVMLPFAAAILRMLFAQHLYIENVVFSLHLHAALFIFGLPFLFLPYQLLYLFVAAALAYFYIALLRVYGEGHFLTILRLPFLLFFFGAVWLAGATAVTALLMRMS